MLRRAETALQHSSIITGLGLPNTDCLDYENALLSGLPAHSQSVLNEAARSIAGLCHSERITTTLAGLQWL
jgi:hypothetical protein